MGRGDEGFCSLFATLNYTVGIRYGTRMGQGRMKARNNAESWQPSTAVHNEIKKDPIVHIPNPERFQRMGEVHLGCSSGKADFTVHAFDKLHYQKH